MKKLYFLAVPAVAGLIAAGAVATTAGAAPTAHEAAASAYSLVVLPDQGESAIYNFINSAKTSVDVTMYELREDRKSVV